MQIPEGACRWTLTLAVTAVMSACFLAPAECQTANPNEREVKSLPSKFDKSGVWAMNFRFKDPRITVVKLPTRGNRICWYLWYQVTNYTAKPEEISPYFELVTLDNPGIYRDEILITAEEKIRKLEDPTGYQDIKNTVLISKFAIPRSKPPDEAFPKRVTGVAIWDAGPADPKKRDPKYKELSDTTHFSIFIRGLSNGFVEVDAPAPGLPPITQYKTLQLNFKRKGDRFSTDSRDIEFVTPPQWIYRSASRTISNAKKNGDDKK
ncbi:MAG: hypothetical protein HYX68_11585 [Planctomycetes bacterium]|nr:hypothetical protein [Planctomycetota bacterium]